MKENDRLYQLNETIRSDVQEHGVAAASSSSAWLPLESNPEILNDFAQRVGLSSDFEFVDYYGPGSIDPDRHTAKAFLLLFPCTESIYEFRQKQADELGTEIGDSRHSNLCFIRQLEGFGNACGTIGCLHACLNTDGAIVASANDSNGDCDGVVPVPLQSFLQQGRGKTPEERGELLLHSQAFKPVSDDAALSSDAQTICPPRDGAFLDHHFVAFCFSSSSSSSPGTIWELDGTKPCPVNHGESSAENFEEDAWNVIQSDFMQVEPDSIEFSLIALVSSASSSTDE
mmetsp:Transcript_9565/g.23187  ORF Transcript_9565/g.23187 Transcript_9565/m.23187 type:complete len:286 (-) Transcript_9565:227-1084(-)